MTLLGALIGIVAAILILAAAGTAYGLRRLRRTESDLQDAIERRYNLLETIPDGLFIVDREERFTMVNEEAERLLGVDSGGLIGATLESVVHPFASDIVPDIRTARRTGEVIERTIAFRATESWVELRVKPGAHETLISLRDVSERTRSDVRLRQSESRLRLLMGQVPALLWTADRNGTISSATGAGLALVETTGLHCVGLPVGAVFGSSDASSALARAYGGDAVVFESTHDTRILRHEVEPLRDDVGAIVGAIGVALDITEMRNTEQRLIAMAQLDALTSLPNRIGLEENLALAIANARATGGCAGVLFVDLDRFKTINDTLGHRAGDDLLRLVAKRLQATLRPGDTIARPGGDEFIITLHTVRDLADIESVAARINRRMVEPFLIDGRELCVGASLGGAIYPEHGSTPEQLIKHADVAMYRAKASGRGTFVVFDGGMQAASLEKLELESDLRNALDRGELECVFQPIVGRSHRIVGCEALLRWANPKRADMDPTVFVGMLEEMGAIVQVTRWVLETAIAFASGVRKKRPDFRVSVNVSGRDLYDPHLALFVGDLLQRTNLAPSGLELEVTESVLLDERAIRTLEQLRALGVRIAVDDFGVSYSVLSCVKRLPITTLKIDRSFVEGVVTSIPDQAIIKAIVALSKALGLRVVAEGIENEIQMQYVTDLDVDELQGFYIGRPMYEAPFVAMLDKVVALERAAESRTQTA